MNDLISVIVPIYNVEKYLRRCLDSIINQTYKNLEIILVDDGSPDNCPEICDEYARKYERVKVIHKKNGGLSDARNIGIKQSKGDYITLIDSDDCVTHDYCEFLYNLLKKYNADMSICKHLVKYDDFGEISTGTKKEYILNPEKALKMLLYSDDIDVSAWGKLYKRKLFDNIEYPKGRLFEDSATTYKLIDLCKTIAFKSEEKYIYFVRKDSITTKEFNEKKMDLITSTKEMCDYVMEKYPQLESAAKRRLMYAYLSTLTQLAKCKNYKNYNEYKAKLMNYIKKNRKEVIKDKLTPRRDRLALYTTYFGFKIFRISWSLYEKRTGRN